MKKSVRILLIIFFVLTCFALCGCGTDSPDTDCIRIHIRANSNDAPDQSVKLLVKEEIVGYLTPLLAECVTKADAYSAIEANLDGIERVADAVLKDNGYDYTANAALRQEKFPTRKYLDYTFPSGVYDALIVELGSGEGDNWWCVAFPPLCFVGDGDDFYYKSKLLEIIEKYYEVKNEK